MFSEIFEPSISNPSKNWTPVAGPSDRIEFLRRKAVLDRLLEIEIEAIQARHKLELDCLEARFQNQMDPYVDEWRMAMTTKITETGIRATGRHLAAAALCCFAVGFAPNQTTAQESHEDRCLGVINMSRGEARSIASQEDFFTHQRNYCREFESARSSGRTASFGVSYNVLSLSASSSRMSTEAVAEQYCEEDGTIRRNEADYNNYKLKSLGKHSRHTKRASEAPETAA